MNYLIDIRPIYSYIISLTKEDIPITIFVEPLCEYVSYLIKTITTDNEMVSTNWYFKIFMLDFISELQVQQLMDYIDFTLKPTLELYLNDIDLRNNDVYIRVAYTGVLVLEIIPKPDELEQVLKRISIQVEHRLNAGEYIDNDLKEIFYAYRKRSNNV